MKKMLLYVLAGVVALAIVAGIGVATSMYVVRQMNGATKTDTKDPEVEIGGGNVFGLKPFVTNLADKNPPRYISITLELVTRTPKEVEKLKENLPVVRDAVVSVLNTKKSTEVVGEVGANTLKTDIREKLNAVLGKPIVEKVLITDVVVQY